MSTLTKLNIFNILYIYFNGDRNSDFSDTEG